MNRILAAILILTACCGFAVQKAAASGVADKAVVLKTVQTALEAAANNEPGKFDSVFASDAIIMDDTPPFAWKGEGSSHRWLSDIHKSVETFGYKEQSPCVVQIVGSHAYVTLPIRFWARLSKGKKNLSLTDSGTWLLSLKKMSGAWKIIGAAWASEHQKVVVVK